jgi:hypothetical protein
MLVTSQCVAMGPGSVGLMEFNVDSCNLRILANKAPLYFVVADLNATKDTVCILRSLNDCFPVPSESNQVIIFHWRSARFPKSVPFRVECTDM